MSTRPDGPADTRMMGIVHGALRRDLRRAHVTLTSAPPPPLRQQQAIARHLTWMMGFLHDHHRSEDEGLYPLVRQRDPSAGALLDMMDADHAAIAPAIAEVGAAAAKYDPLTADASLDDLVGTVERLSAILLPHLRREEDDVMPIVSAAITDAEWRSLDQRDNIGPRSFAELGRVGHWLIDDASAEDRATVLGLVPPIPRFLLLHRFARSYRRLTAACWDGAPPPTRRVQKVGRSTVRVAADVDAVWEVVVDVDRVGEWSHECMGISWLDGATHARPGARFRGRNRQGIFRWGRVCEVETVEPYDLVWRTVPTRLYPDSTVWMIRVRPGDGGTDLEQTFSVVRGPKALDVLYATFVRGHRDRTAALTEDLRRLGALATTSAATVAPGAVCA